MNSAHFSSRKDDWETPQWLFDILDAEFGGFTLDVCAIEENKKCANYFSPEIDALKQEWRGMCWCNPPYGRKIKDFIDKAHKSSLAGATVCCLIPARPDTVSWHKTITLASEIRFLKGRLIFEKAKNSAPFPSAIVIFKPGHNGTPHVSFVDVKQVGTVWHAAELFLNDQDPGGIIHAKQS